MGKRFTVGDKVKLLECFNGLRLSEDIHRAICTLEQSDRNFVNDRAYDVRRFVCHASKDMVGIVSEADGHYKIQNRVLQVIPVRGVCLREWWVPASIFQIYQEDWLEDMPVGVSYA